MPGQLALPYKDWPRPEPHAKQLDQAGKLLETGLGDSEVCAKHVWLTEALACGSSCRRNASSEVTSSSTTPEKRSMWNASCWKVVSRPVSASSRKLSLGGVPFGTSVVTKCEYKANTKQAKEGKQ